MTSVKKGDTNLRLGNEMSVGFEVGDTHELLFVRVDVSADALDAVGPSFFRVARSLVLGASSQRSETEHVDVLLEPDAVVERARQPIEGESARERVREARVSGPELLERLDEVSSSDADDVGLADDAGRVFRLA